MIDRSFLEIIKWVTRGTATLQLYTQTKLSNLKLRLKKITLDIKKWFRKEISALWLSTYKIQKKLSDWNFRYGNYIFHTVLVILISISVFLLPIIQDFLRTYYSTDMAIESLRSLILNVGIALIGASVIVTTLVLFAMQVNIERMPHGLFRRLSEDWKLLGLFTLAFLLAISLTILSLLTNQVSVAIIILTSLWIVILTLILFWYAYRRALILINPLQQLKILILDTRKDLQT